MSSLIHKQIIVGVTGGIAAYKSAELIRQLRQQGAEVRVVMTSGACQFITPLTLQALSGHPVHQHLLDPTTEAAMGHIELARWADAIVIAPATAQCITELAAGHADQLLTAVCLASQNVPSILAPAMNQQMWHHPNTQRNVARLSEQGWHMVGPAYGEQACGEVGPGRMSEPQDIVQAVTDLFSTGALADCRILLTAGPTVEAIDPVRFVSNHSSGKMGYALAAAAVEAGAQVTLISGPVALPFPEHVQGVRVTDAEQMLAQVLQQVEHCDVFIGCAAVADYRPTQSALHKLKKSDQPFTLEFVPNPDIIATVARLPNKPIVIGFAAQTMDLIKNARQKLMTKGLDGIVANLVGGADRGFNADDNALTLIDDNNEINLPLMSKQQGARKIIKWLVQQFWQNNMKDKSV
ncbi:MAG: bifunctional phosphopantothenoylcysteine decarboxylase/phosphopantothenate--cysteine ligase CoaBC [Legionellales bacterium]|nr:bifunctional phosphopantothenoylcysteine decarboxylase/phosphopantothenate--cysteine ligase CoaBC [Legionellales bacterium]